jgi:hypothetical protein
MKTRKIEVYLAYTNHTWDTEIIEIPRNTPERRLVETAEKEAMKLFFNNPNTHDEVAFIGVYNSEVDDEKE